MFLGYASNSMAYYVYNRKTGRVEESVNVVFDDCCKTSFDSVHFEMEELTLNRSGVQDEEESEQHALNNLESQNLQDSVVSNKRRVHKNHSESDVIGGLDERKVTKGKQINFREMIQFSCFVSLMEPKDIQPALEDEL